MGTYLGQNFLIDSKVKYYIFEKIQKLYTDLGCESLIEIGPGKGSITTLIHSISPNFFVIEKDDLLVQNLECRVQNNIKLSNLGTITSELGTHINIITGDVLQTDVEEILIEKKLSPKKTLVVGNLPYYITSPILRKFFTDDDRGFGTDDFGGYKNRFAGGIFMVQDEVGQKLRSDAKKKSYLRRLLNYAYDVTYLKGVPAKCFKPAPKVKSCLIQLTTKNEQLTINREKLIEFLELFSPFSRKTLGAIQTMLNKRFAIKAPPDFSRVRDKQPSADKNSSSTHDKRIKAPCGRDKMINFVIPESLQKKRLEELTWNDLTAILNRAKGQGTRDEE